jgi:hypothetical protein
MGREPFLIPSGAGPLSGARLLLMPAYLKAI